MVRAWWQLLRGGNALLSGIASWVGSYLASGNPLYPDIVAVVLTPILITAAGNIENDLCDRDLDRVIKPYRPLVTGAISPTAARVAASAMRILALAVAAYAGAWPLLVALVVVVALTFYNRVLSGWPVLGNVVIAILGALPIVYGALVADRVFADADLDLAMIGAVIAFWLHLPRELIKDALDIDGDRQVGRRTLAALVGARQTARWAAAAMVIAALYVGWSAIHGCFGILYSFGVFATVIPSLILGASQCFFTGSDTETLSRWTVGLKLNMMAGLVWLVLGRIP